MSPGQRSTHCDDWGCMGKDNEKKKKKKEGRSLNEDLKFK